ncbi:MAG: T9SS type A sorting domain-containing protein [candidate division Zixibacteria bacterium]|nr:T9SS type A sorting domain-containing protein [candidate division Zixibacteria bacterium]
MKSLLIHICLIVFFLGALVVADDLVYHGSFLWNDIRDIEYLDGKLYCAFYDGVGVIDLQRDYNRKKIYSSIDIPGQPLKLYVSDNRLAVLTEEGKIHLVDIGNPGDMNYLGEFTPEWEIWDIEFLGDYLYAAIEYNGIARYDISDPDNISFSDSSMYGIRVIDLEVQDSLLLALDDYNGILFYKPDSSGFNFPISELLLPEQAVSFTVFSDTIYAGIRPNGYMIADISSIDNPEYLDTKQSLLRGDLIFPTSHGIILANSVAGFELMYSYPDSSIDQIFPISDIVGSVEVFSFDGGTIVAFPHNDLGFVAFVVDDPVTIDVNRPDIILANPGPITQLEFVNQRLHTIGTNNWYELYELNDPANPRRTGTMINPPYIPLGMCKKGDTLFVADGQTSLIFPAVDNGTGNPTVVPPFFSIANVLARPFLEYGVLEPQENFFYCLVNEFVLGASRDRDGFTSNRVEWNFTNELTTVQLDDTIIYAGYFNGDFGVYGLTEEKTIYSIYTHYGFSRVNDIVQNDSLLYLASNGLITVKIEDGYSLTEITTSPIPGTVNQIVRLENQLYCAAQNGIFVFDISSGIPQLEFSGGMEASFLAVDNQTIAASDSRSVKIYTLPILDIGDEFPLPEVYDLPKITGYPNPFNPAITLVMEGFGSQENELTVEVFNILGRKIKTMNIFTAGLSLKHEVIWDGTDENGARVASGVYLFRVYNESENAVFRAILIK